MWLYEEKGLSFINAKVSDKRSDLRFSAFQILFNFSSCQDKNSSKLIAPYEIFLSAESFLGLVEHFNWSPKTTDSGALGMKRNRLG